MQDTMVPCLELKATTKAVAKTSEVQLPISPKATKTLLQRCGRVKPVLTRVESAGVSSLVL